MKNIIRHTPSLFWNFIEQGVNVGISRLVLFPIVAHVVGKDEFGLFATTLSFVLIVGYQPAMGLATGLLRNLASYEDKKQDQLNTTAFLMCHKFLLYFLGSLLLLLVGIMFFGIIGLKTYLCLTFLGISLYAENELILLLTSLRYKRQFREHAQWYIGSSLCVLTLGLIGLYTAGIAGVAFGIMTANFFVYGLAVKKYFKANTGYNVVQARMLRWIWIHSAIAGMLILAGPHLNRIVLRMYWDNESVADLFAAAGIAHVFVFPITNSSRLLLSMISKYKTINQLSSKLIKMLFAMMVGASIIGMVFFIFGSPLLLKLLFPGFGDRASKLFDILVWMIPATITISFVRPFITKFANIAWMPRINLAVLSVTITMMFSLIPHWGLEGAAWSIASGNIFSALLQTVIFLIIYTRAKKALNTGSISEQMEIASNNNYTAEEI